MKTAAACVGFLGLGLILGGAVLAGAIVAACACVLDLVGERA